MERAGHTNPKTNDLDATWEGVCKGIEDSSFKRSRATEVGPEHAQLLRGSSNPGFKESGASKASSTWPELRTKRELSDLAKLVTGSEDTEPHRDDPRTGGGSSRRMESCIDGDTSVRRGSSTEGDGPNFVELRNSTLGSVLARSRAKSRAPEQERLLSGKAESKKA